MYCFFYFSSLFLFLIADQLQQHLLEPCFGEEIIFQGIRHRHRGIQTRSPHHRGIEIVETIFGYVLTLPSPQNAFITVLYRFGNPKKS